MTTTATTFQGRKYQVTNEQLHQSGPIAKTMMVKGQRGAVAMIWEMVDGRRLFLDGYRKIITE